jgi:shikimate dehydrogenase
MKTYGLIGKTLSHSFSKRYFTDKFEFEGLSDSCVYKNFELKAIEEFKNLLQKETSLHGLNVTLPYKEQIIPFLDHVDSVALQIGAVNTIKITRTLSGSIYQLTGFNTDVTGFSKTLKPLLQEHHKGALILGTGGASKAVEWVLNELNIPFKKVSRSPEKDMLSYDQLNKETMQEFPVIINTTPVGTFPGIEDAPLIPYEHLSSKNLLYDLIYNPAQTKFLRMAMLNDAIVCNGLEMLKIQAEESWIIWNSPDTDGILEQ